MDSTIFDKIKVKPIIITFRVITAILFLIFLIKRLLVNYEHIYPFGLGLEYSLQSTILCVLFLLLFCISFINPIAKNSKGAIIFCVISILCFIITLTVTKNIAQMSVFESNKIDSEVSSYFSFDEYIDNDSKQNYYYLRTVKLLDTYWVGCNLNKKYESKTTLEDLTEDVSERDIIVSYYYMKNPSKYRIKELLKKTEFSDFNIVYDEEIHTDDYSVYVYNDTYEFVSISDNEVFHLTADKKKRTYYDLDEFTAYSQNLMNTLKNSY